MQWKSWSRSDTLLAAWIRCYNFGWSTAAKAFKFTHGIIHSRYSGDRKLVCFPGFFFARFTRIFGRRSRTCWPLSWSNVPWIAQNTIMSWKNQKMKIPHDLIFGHKFCRRIVKCLCLCFAKEIRVIACLSPEESAMELKERNIFNHSESFGDVFGGVLSNVIHYPLSKPWKVTRGRCARSICEPT